MSKKGNNKKEILNLRIGMLASCAGEKTTETRRGMETKYWLHGSRIKKDRATLSAHSSLWRRVRERINKSLVTLARDTRARASADAARATSTHGDVYAQRVVRCSIVRNATMRTKDLSISNRVE